MIINLTYIFFVLIGIYFGIVTYIETRKREVFLVLGVFVFSFFLELDRLNTASYRLGLNDFLWTTRDTIRTIIMIMFFQCMRKYFPYTAPAKSAKKPKKR